MRPSLLVAQVATISLGYAVASAVELDPRDSNANSNLVTCKAIQLLMSSQSAVYYPGSVNYTADVHRWQPNNIVNATCSVEPGTANDVSTILKVLGKTTTPFAIKAGGHSFNKDYSSTTGVQISLNRLNGVSYDAKSKTVTMGMGNTWDQVYAALEPKNVTVSGGRIVGVGVGGLLLCGGYSYLTNQGGLSMDNVVSYQVVLPDGTITTASNSVNTDLFWGLKGGFNNFGIVTQAVVQAHPIGAVYGGTVTYSGASIALLPSALANYSSMQAGPNPLPKAGLSLGYKVSPGAAPVATLRLFYDGATPPAQLLAPWASIPNVSSTLGVRSYTSLIDSVSTPFLTTIRGSTTTASVYTYSPKIVSQFMTILNNLGTTLANGSLATMTFEPWIPSAITRPLSSGVFPHSVYASPFYSSVAWSDPSQDATLVQASNNIENQFEAALRADGQPVDQMMQYCNYAGTDIKIEDIYGPNLAKAKALRKKIDPNGVMLRAGGWKFV